MNTTKTWKGEKNQNASNVDNAPTTNTFWKLDGRDKKRHPFTREEAKVKKAELDTMYHTDSTKSSWHPAEIHVARGYRLKNRELGYYVTITSKKPHKKRKFN